MSFIFSVSIIISLLILFIKLIYELVSKYYNYVNNIDKSGIYCEDCLYCMPGRFCKKACISTTLNTEGNYYYKPHTTTTIDYEPCCVINQNNDCTNFKVKNFFQYWFME